MVLNICRFPPLQLPVSSSHPEAPDPTAPAPECREGAAMQVPSSVGDTGVPASPSSLPQHRTHSSLVQLLGLSIL